VDQRHHLALRAPRDHAGPAAERGGADGPALLLGLFAGVWLDRLRRRPILIVANPACAVLLGSIPLAAALGVLYLAQL
jgi:hypothetical protein